MHDKNLNWVHGYTDLTDFHGMDTDFYFKMKLKINLKICTNPFNPYIHYIAFFPKWNIYSSLKC
jgi:hypothetical protein